MNDYFSIPAMSASAIKAGAVSMLNMQEFLENGKEPTAAMATGTLRHMAVLEPDKFQAIPVCDLDKRTKEYKEFVAKYGPDTIKTVEFEEHKKAAIMVFDHPAVKQLHLFDDGAAECDIYWKEGDVACKAKIDWVAENYIIEFKTTTQLGRFAATSAGLFYHLQLGWYWRAASATKAKKVYVVAQEQNAPFDVAVFEVPQLMLKQWFDDCMEIVRRYNSGDRSGRFNELMTFELPAWMATREVELTEDQIQF
jgi:hypothetical protein